MKNTDADVQLITNVPSRMGKYYDTKAGDNMRSAARQNINIYISKLNPDNFPGQFTPYFNIYNHAKLIGTENIVYIGSANYSNESANNIETGVLIEDKEFIMKLYAEFFDKVRKDSPPISTRISVPFSFSFCPFMQNLNTIITRCWKTCIQTI